MTALCMTISHFQVWPPGVWWPFPIVTALCVRWPYSTFHFPLSSIDNCLVWWPFPTFKYWLHIYICMPCVWWPFPTFKYRWLHALCVWWPFPTFIDSTARFVCVMTISHFQAVCACGRGCMHSTRSTIVLGLQFLLVPGKSAVHLLEKLLRELFNQQYES